MPARRLPACLPARLNRVNEYARSRFETHVVAIKLFTVPPHTLLLLVLLPLLLMMTTALDENNDNHTIIVMALIMITLITHHHANGLGPSPLDTGNL